MLKNKTKVELLVIGLIVIAVAGVAFFSNDGTYKVEAKRIALYDGNLYRASNIFGSAQITFSRDIKILFEEKNGKLLLGKGYSSLSGDPLDFASTTLYMANEDGTGEIKVSPKADVTYAMFDKTGENIIYLVKDGHTKRDIYKYNIKTKKNTLLSENASVPDLSPDGRRLVYVKKPKNWEMGESFLGFAIMDIATGKETIVPGTKEFNDPNWTPDGLSIIFSGLGIINFDGTGFSEMRESGFRIETHGEFGNPAWSSDGKYFIYDFNREVVVAELDLANKKIVSINTIAYGTSPQWVEEGKTISVLSPNANAGDEALSVVTLEGKVLSGDKSKESKYYKNGKSLLRVKPIPVAQ